VLIGKGFNEGGLETGKFAAFALEQTIRIKKLEQFFC
jgi:hypothetical protein